MNKIKKFIFHHLLNKQERERLCDAYAYIQQYEDECKNPSHSCNQFCMDMANCRKLLVDICGFSKGWDGFDKETYSNIEQDIKEHAYNHRYSSTYAPFIHENYNGCDVDVCGIMQVRFE